MGVRRIALVALLGTLSLGRAAAADEIVVQGDRLRGTVVTVTAKTVVFETTYGKGSIEIPLEEVESLTTEKEYVLSHGDEGMTQGRILDVEEGVVLVGPEGSSEPVRVQTSELQLVQSREAYEESPLAAAKSQLRYWSGNLDLGFSLTRSTVDSTNFGAGLGVNRVKGPTRFSFDTGYTYGTQQKRGESSTKLADQLFGKVREEYDLTPRFFGYGNGWLEYNGIQRVSVRGIPEAGVGYKFWTSEEKDSTDFFAGTVGGSWVYEKFFGGLTRDYFAVSFGLQAQVPLPYGAKFTGSVSYLPSVSDFTNDFLLKSEAALLFPVYRQLSFKLSVVDDYDNTPAPGTAFNFLTTMIGLSASL
ncbi:MAG: DUF481 domain-containing protein [Deltaproteobacteria bacterium]|nr:DUF481 domain-containing protein [Deltaproteobacteria bacterium]